MIGVTDTPSCLLLKDSESAELSLVSLVALVKAPIIIKTLLKDLLDER